MSSIDWGARVRKRLAKAKTCYYCLRTLTWDGVKAESHKTIDHFIPVSKGGGNTNNNAVICCATCNRMKGNYMPDEFIEILKRLIKNRAYQVYTYSELHHVIYQVEQFKTQITL